MLETPHVAVGAAIAAKIPNPFIAIPLAFASHFIMEKVPHWNPHLVTETKKYGMPTKKSMIIIAVDVVLALVLGGYVAWRALPDTGHAITILLASFASVLPDLMESPYFFLKMRSKFIKNWLNFQKSLQVDTTFYWGMLNQALVILACLWWIRN
jgi:hypothetical protein